MVFNIGDFAGGLVQDAAAGGAAGGSDRDGLDLTIDAINRVITTINNQQEQITPVGFAFGALIYPTAFGGADRAPNLGTHYSRAHEVTWKTLEGIKQDLEDFQEACRQAMKEIESADDDAAARNRALLNATDDLQMGQTARQSVRDHQDAQQNQNVDGSEG